MSVFYIDGEYMDSKDAVLSVSDMAVLRGYGIFDFMRTYNGRPFYLKEHIQRLANSGAHVGLDLPCSQEELFDIVMETLKRNSFEESNVRIVYTGGISPDSVTPQGNGKLMVMVTEKLDLPEWWYTDGAKIITNDVERYMPEAKSTNYMNAVLSLQKAKKADAIESVYVDRDGRVLEGTTTNIFLYSGGKWVTSDKGILPGITRSVVLDLLEGEFEVELRDLSREDIKKAEEVMISASNKEIVPIIQVDELTIADGKPGEKTLKVMELFKEFTTAYGLGKTDSVKEKTAV
ncbi:MAG: aminotransferase class IV [Spirochaetales bacterium]|nr:aminotransferase class IV [Spirochaetales bacterium]